MNCCQSFFSRNHNANFYRRQDPASWDDDFAYAVRDVYIERYRMLPYLYTLTYNAHTQGSTVVRSLMMEFPEDREALTIDEQFLWGSHFLISPGLSESTEVRAYFPVETQWFDYWTGLRMQPGWNILHTPLNKINLHFRKGAIIPMQEPAVVTFESRQKPFEILYVIGPNENIFQGNQFQSFIAIFISILI